MNYKVADENPKLQYYILRFVYLVVIALSIFVVTKGNYIFFYKLLKLSSVILLGSSLLIGESSRLIKKKILISYICIAMFWALLPEVFFLVDDTSIVSKENLFIYKLVIVFIQYIVLAISILGNIKKESFKKLNFKICIIYILAHLLCVLFISDVQIKNYIINSSYKNYIMFLYVLSMFFIIFVIIKSNIKKDNKFFGYTVLYLIIESIGNLLLLNFIYVNINLYSFMILLGLILRFTAYYILAEGVIRLSLNKNLNDINRDIELKRKEYKRNKKYLEKKLEELKDLEEMLEKEERLFNKFISSIGDYIFLFNNDRLFYINNQALEFLGITNRESIIFEKIDEINTMINSKLVYAKDSCDNEKNYSEIIFRNNKNEFLEGELYTIDFSERYKIIIIKDVTGRNKALRLNTYLSKQLDEENIKGEFFTNISHELRTPINVINSALQLNDINIRAKNLKSVIRNNFIIRQNCLRLIRTINNFIDANRISEGQIEGTITVYNIVEVVENIIEASAPYIKKKNINFIFDPDLEEVFIAFDREFLERIVLNILSNSVKYGRENGSIYVRIYFEENNLVILIENDGVSISCDEQKYIFDKFTKNNKALNRTQEGSGLGLYISKSLMKMQGGDLKVNIYDRIGNQFKLYFYNVGLFKENARTESYAENEIYNLLEKAEIEFSDIYV